MKMTQRQIENIVEKAAKNALKQIIREGIGLDVAKDEFRRGLKGDDTGLQNSDQNYSDYSSKRKDYNNSRKNLNTYKKAKKSSEKANIPTRATMWNKNIEDGEREKLQNARDAVSTRPGFMGNLNRKTASTAHKMGKGIRNMKNKYRQTKDTFHDITGF